MLAHHAILHITNNQTNAIRSFRESCGSQVEVVPIIAESLTIDEVRRVITLAYQTPGTYAERALVIAARSINHAAQHALLKVLEEPPLTTKFYIILPTTAGLLPTVLSRVIIDQGVEVVDQPHFLFTAFLEATIPDRLALIADIVKRKADTDYDALYDGLVAFASVVTVTDMLVAINGALWSLRQKGAARKMIWEHLALTFPVQAKR